FGSSPNKVGDEAINEEMLDRVERAATTTTSLEAEHASGNIYKTQFTATLNEQFSLELGSGSGPWRQETMGGGHTLGSGEDSMEHQIELTDNVANTPYDSPLPGVNTPGSDEGGLKLEELMAKCKKLSKQVLDLEKEKDAQAVKIFKLKKRVKKLERQRKSSISHPRRRIYSQVESFDDDLDEEDASKQGRTSDKTKPMFKDKNQGKIGADDTEVVKGSGDTEAVNTAGEGVSTASVPETVSTVAPRTPPTTTTFFDDEDVTMAMAQTLIKMKEEKAKEKGVAIKDVEDSSRPIRSITTLQPLPTIDPKDKERDAKAALRLLAELDEELRLERERQEEASKVAIAEMFDEVQVRMDADYELAARMTQEEQEKYTSEERATYLKNMGGYKHSQLKGKTYEEIQGLYEKEQKFIHEFVPMDSKKEEKKSMEPESEGKKSKRLKRIAGFICKTEVAAQTKIMKSVKNVQRRSSRV
ncbi:hypothetical protein Tco_1294431, partial [Tanacetum coccineum]